VKKQDEPNPRVPSRCQVVQKLKEILDADSDSDSV